MRTKLLFHSITLLITSLSYAEKETFDMALTGEFDKDFCHLEYINTNIKGTTFDSKSPLGSSIEVSSDPGRDYYSVIENNRAEINVHCTTRTDGLYTIELNTSDLADENNNYKLAVNASAWGNDAWISNTDTGTFYLSPTFPEASTNSTNITFGYAISPIDGNYLNLPDSFSTNVAIIVTITPPS